jgi:hypothetical protein
VKKKEVTPKMLSNEIQEYLMMKIEELNAKLKRPKIKNMDRLKIKVKLR